MKMVVIQKTNECDSKIDTNQMELSKTTVIHSNICL